MKNILFAIFVFLPALCMAQNWETVVPPTTKVKETPLEMNARKLTKAEKEAMKYEAEKPYLAGAVPEVDGEVVYSIDLNVPGKSAQEIYDRTFAFLQSLAQGENSLDGSKIALVDKESKSIVAQYEEWMVFSKKILELDRTQFNYVIEANCSDNAVSLRISRLRYAFEIDRPNGFRAHAEELITDKVMLSKDGKQLNKKNAKFRRKTVDRMNEITETFKLAMGL